jgi:hypothetical protein
MVSGPGERPHPVWRSPLTGQAATKEQLVTDREQQVEDRLYGLIRYRSAAITPAAAVRSFVLAAVAGIRGIPPEVCRARSPIWRSSVRPSTGWRRS